MAIWICQPWVLAAQGSWETSRKLSPVCRGRRLFCSTLCWCSLTLSNVCSFGITIQEGYKVIRVCTEQGDQNGERPWGQDLQCLAKVPWLVQLREETAEGRAHSSLQLSHRQMWRGRCWSPLCGNQWQSLSKWNKAALGKVQTGR